MKRTRIVVVSDMHVGSIYGLAPPTSVPHDKQSPFILWVYEQWQKFCRMFSNPDYLLLLGDLADGAQVKILGSDALTTNLDDQEAMAVDLLQPLLGGSTKIYGINGSGYHGGEGQATNLDRRVTEKLGGEFKNSVFEFDIGLERIQICHGGIGVALVNPSTYIQREIRLAKEDAQKRKAKCPTMIVRGHQHRMYSIQDDGGIWGILNGCWQSTTPFAFKRSANISPNIGATIIDIEDGIAKIYRVEFPIPEDVRQAMYGYEVLRERTIRKHKDKDRQEWVKLQKQRR